MEKETKQNQFQAIYRRNKTKLNTALLAVLFMCFMLYIYSSMLSRRNDMIQMNAVNVMNPMIAEQWRESNNSKDIELIMEGYETQYNLLRQREKNGEPADVFNHFGAHWPCIWGEHLIGLHQNFIDGVKWGCGVQHINENLNGEQCIVYSVGSNNNFVFEEGLHSLAPDCKIFTFDPFVRRPKIPQSLLETLEFKKWGISGEDDEKNNFYLLSTIMKKLGHSYIDILKIDVEGWEWPTFQRLDELDLFPSIGQLYIEIHIANVGDLAPPKANLTDGMNKLWQIFEKNGLRAFHKELNPDQLDKCSEYSFIQKYWHPKIRKYT